MEREFLSIQCLLFVIVSNKKVAYYIIFTKIIKMLANY